MTTRRPDAKRRLLPRWRASNDAVRSGELRSPRTRNRVHATTLESPHFENLVLEWKITPTLEVAADLVSSAVALGRTEDKFVQEAAAKIDKSDAPRELITLAQRLLSGTLGAVDPADGISFDSDRARAELQSQIALHKRRVRTYPQNALAWTDLARLYTSLGQEKKAIDALRISTNLAPE